jgi:predicted esterase
LDNARDAVLHVPAGAGEAPLPLLVLLHGAGGSGEPFLRGLRAAADASGVAMLAPDSRGRTWDAIRAEHQSVLDVITSQRHFSGFGPDVLFLDRALERVFRTLTVDSERITVGGFSDGATYALSLGLINGDLFRRIVAFSPGFIVNAEAHGLPQIFVSHGRADSILPIDRCSRRIVPGLEKRGYAVTFREFDGGHDVPEVIAREAMRWVADGGAIGGKISG